APAWQPAGASPRPGADGRRRGPARGDLAPPGGAVSAPSSRLTLAVDCATSYLALALVDAEGRVVASLAADVGREHASRLVPELHAITNGVPGWRERLERVVAGVGPGSYTGL